jgi:hypothetical protein
MPDSGTSAQRVPGGEPDADHLKPLTGIGRMAQPPVRTGADDGLTGLDLNVPGEAAAQGRYRPLPYGHASSGDRDAGQHAGSAAPVAHRQSRQPDRDRECAETGWPPRQRQQPRRRRIEVSLGGHQRSVRATSALTHYLDAFEGADQFQ